MELSGLSEEEAKKRLEQYGYNEITAKKRSPVVIFLSKFYGPIPLLLWIVIILSYVLKHMADFYIIIALLIFNAIVSFFEEYKADKSIELLKEKLTINARVLRSGKWVLLPSREIVPGDIIRLRLGDIVPADAKLVEAESIEADESVLTGEALPKPKYVGDMVYAGSAIRRGEGTAVVTATGYSSYYGKTAKLVEEARPELHLEKVIMRIIRYLIIADVFVILAMFAYGVLVVHTSLAIILPFLLVIFIASVPVALPAAFTVAMALGTEKLAKSNILITKLDAIEEAATMNILCMDKTGTITKNQIEVKEVKPFGKFSQEEVLKYAAEASREEDKDLIDLAVIKETHAKKISTGKQIRFVPFDPSTKRTEATIQAEKAYKVSKGAEKSIEKLCNAKGRLLEEARNSAIEFSKNGYRSIFVAVNKGKWELVGVIALYDAPRQDAPMLIKELRSLGIVPKMLTGDNIATAEEVAVEVGIGKNIVDADTIRNKNEKSVEKLIINADGFAEIYPTDKYMIVKALQKHGNIVGMTGDGVNDAPALKQADVGIAVENALDVAKSAATLVLTKSGIDVIINAVKESRRIFERMITYTIAKISKVMQIIMFIAVVFVAFRFIPILPFQLILLIFTNDIVNISIATDNARYSQGPDTWHVRAIVYSSFAIGLMLLVEMLLLLPVKAALGMSIAEFQTAAFLMFDISDKFAVMNIRERKAFYKSRPSKVLVLSALAGIIAGIIIAYYGIFVKSIGLEPIAIIIAISVLFLFLVDIVKIKVFKHFGIG